MMRRHGSLEEASFISDTKHRTVVNGETKRQSMVGMREISSKRADCPATFHHDNPAAREGSQWLHSLCRDEELSNSVFKGSLRSLATASFLRVCMKWPSPHTSEFRIPLSSVQSMDPIRLHRFLERFVYDQTGLDRTHGLKMWVGDQPMTGNVPAEDLAGKVVEVVVNEQSPQIRLQAAINLQCKQDHRWLSRVIVREAESDQVDAFRVDFQGVTVENPPVFVRVSPQKNEDQVLERCVWVTMDRHPHIASVLFTAGPNLFFMSSDQVNAREWLHANAHGALESADTQQKVVLNMALHTAAALEHLHCMGALHLDVKPSNLCVGIAEMEEGRPLHERVHCQLCDWELSSEIQGVFGAISKRGTPGFWSPEQVVDLPAGASTAKRGVKADHGGISAISAYWRDVSPDPPPDSPPSCTLTTFCDSWGWATTVLDLLGSELDRMRVQGYREYVGQLARVGTEEAARGGKADEGERVDGGISGADGDVKDGLLDWSESGCETPKEHGDFHGAVDAEFESPFRSMQADWTVSPNKDVKTELFEFECERQNDLSTAEAGRRHVPDGETEGSVRTEVWKPSAVVRRVDAGLSGIGRQLSCSVSTGSRYAHPDTAKAEMQALIETERLGGGVHGGHASLDAGRQDCAEAKEDRQASPSAFDGKRGASLAGILYKCLRVAPFRRPHMAVIVRTLRAIQRLDAESSPPSHSDRSSLARSGDVEHTGRLNCGPATAHAAVRSEEVEARTAHEVCVALMGPTSHQTWTATRRYVQVLCEDGKLSLAEDLCVRLLTEAAEASMSGVVLAQAQGVLAWILAKQHKYEESLECYERAVQIHGEHNTEGLWGLQLSKLKQEMGAVHEAIGNLASAVDRYEEALGVAEAVLGSLHPQLGDILVSLAGAAERSHRISEALERYARAERVFALAVGHDHSRVADVKNCAGALHAAHEQYQSALERYKEALILYKRSGADDLKIAAQYRKIGEVLRVKGELKEALWYLDQTLQTRLRLLGTRHCALSHFRLAQVFMRLGDLDPAIAHYKKSLECHAQAAHGGIVTGEVVDVAVALKELAEAYEQKGQVDKAWTLSQRALDRVRARSGVSRGGNTAGQNETAQVQSDVVALQRRLRDRNSIWGMLRHSSRDWDPLWVRDELVCSDPCLLIVEAVDCSVCRTPFTLLRRRHHCRLCGQVVCNACSPHKPRGKRICSPCYRGDGPEIPRLFSEHSSWGAEGAQHVSVREWMAEGGGAEVCLPDFTAESCGAY